MVSTSISVTRKNSTRRTITTYLTWAKNVAAIEAKASSPSLDAMYANGPVATPYDQSNRGITELESAREAKK